MFIVLLMEVLSDSFPRQDFPQTLGLSYLLSIPAFVSQCEEKKKERKKKTRKRYIYMREERFILSGSDKEFQNFDTDILLHQSILMHQPIFKGPGWLSPPAD
jgi:hypothetical protein